LKQRSYIALFVLLATARLYSETPAATPETPAAPATQQIAAPPVAPAVATPTVAAPAATDPAASPAAAAPATGAPADATAGVPPAATPGATPPAGQAEAAPTTPPVAGEVAPENSEAAEADAEAAAGEDKNITTNERAQRKTGIARLIKKLSDKEGNPIPIAILTPLDYTTLNFADVATETILSTISRYGKFDLRTIKYSPASLTLEEFRRVVIKFKVDVVVVCVLKPTNFDMFLFDRRTPYNVYAHSEVLPEGVQYQLNKGVVEEFTKAIVRRTLYAYMQDQYFELPREESRSLLSAELPRWMASAESLKLLNHEILSNWYGSVSVGAALMAAGSKSWNSNLVEFELGRRLTDQLYVEAALDYFAYNAELLSLKYMPENRESPLHYLLGIGLASIGNKHTLNWDQTFSQGAGGTYVALSGSISFPIVEVHVKVESRLFIGGGKFILTMMPGLFLMF